MVSAMCIYSLFDDESQPAFWACVCIMDVIPCRGIKSDISREDELWFTIVNKLQLSPRSIFELIDWILVFLFSCFLLLLVDPCEICQWSKTKIALLTKYKKYSYLIKRKIQFLVSEFWIPTKVKYFTKYSRTEFCLRKSPFPSLMSSSSCYETHAGFLITWKSPKR
jgi:hypothetical protein